MKIPVLGFCRSPKRAATLLAWQALLLGMLALGNLANAASVNALELLHRTAFDWQQRSDRLALAKDLIDRIDELTERVPLQEPAELQRIQAREARLTQENPQGLTRLFLSAAYQHRQLANDLEGMKRELQCVRGADQLPREMRCWHATAMLLLKEEQLRIALDTLRRSRRMPPRREEPLFLKDPQLWFAQFGQGILIHIIDPYLESEADRASS